MQTDTALEPATGPAVGLGVLGCADIAVRRALPALVHSPLQLVAIASRSGEKAAKVAARFGGKAVEGYAPLLEMSDVDAVYIPLPNSEHAKWARRALEAGKHVLIEKPAVDDAGTARALVALAERQGLLVMENFAFLQHPQHEQALAIVRNGEIGELRSYSGTFGVPLTDPSGIRYQAALGGGSLWEVGCYPVRAAQEYLDSSIQVLGAGLEVDPDLGVDTSGTALLRDGRGVTASCSFGLTHSYRSTYEIWGSHGRLVLEWAFTPARESRPVLRLDQRDRETRLQAPASDQFVGVMNAFSAAIEAAGLRSAQHQALVRQAELMAAIRDRALSGPT